jgi:RHS repeat-associated protein
MMPKPDPTLDRTLGRIYLLEGAGGIGGLLARSSYSAGNWTNHACYFADGNGNITYLVDASQSMAASYRYAPFGKTLAADGPLANDNVYQFSSKERVQIDPQGDVPAFESLYYFGYRFYSPYLQRWINRDPLEERGGLNLYRCSLNNTVCLIDALGLACPAGYISQGTFWISTAPVTINAELPYSESWVAGFRTRYDAACHVWVECYNCVQEGTMDQTIVISTQYQVELCYNFATSGTRAIWVPTGRVDTHSTVSGVSYHLGPPKCSWGSCGAGPTA